MNILVIRHGQPNDESKTGGEGDPPLSELGLRQAQAIGDMLAQEHIDHIVASQWCVPTKPHFLCVRISEWNPSSTMT